MPEAGAAAPGRPAIVIDVPESLLAKFADGSRVTARPVLAPELELGGTLSVAAYPASTKGDVCVFPGSVTIEGDAPEMPFGTHVDVVVEAKP